MDGAEDGGRGGCEVIGEDSDDEVGGVDGSFDGEIDGSVDAQCHFYVGIWHLIIIT